MFGLPKKQGLYDPSFERDSCGVGFVCNINGNKTHDIVEKGIEVLNRLSHRGATGSDPKTGDGAGILIQIPQEYFLSECSKIGIKLTEEYAAGFVFLPQNKDDRRACEKIIENLIVDEKQEFLGFRDVAVNNSDIGEVAKKTQPVMRQIFIGRGQNVSDKINFETRLYIIRKLIESKVERSDIKQKDFFYIPSLSSKTIVYKGLLMPSQLKSFYPELSDPRIKSALCLVHSRYSTNTFPTWDLAQPFRFLAHNGEINTLRGNINWTRAREKMLNSDVLGNELKKILPVIVEGGSDSAALDNVLEMLVMCGRSLPHSMMMLIPPAWEKNELMDKKHRAFYEYHACLTEPWDGPAAVAFTDGRFIGGILDRNGLRPCRYVITKDGTIVLASEVGVLDIDPKDILLSSRLMPGRVFLIDTQGGSIIDDKELKDDLSSRKPYGKWLKDNILNLKDIRPAKKIKKTRESDLFKLQQAFGYTKEDIKTLIKPMAEKGQEPVGSMGNDTPLAVLSKRPQLLFNYFKQLFAQVTNPPIDPIREEIVMSYDSYIGPQSNLLNETPVHCHRLKIKNPVLTNEDLEKIREINQSGFRSKTISILFDVKSDPDMKKTIKRICDEASSAAKRGYSFIILSDRGVDKNKAAVPSLLAVASLHSYLTVKGERTRIGFIVESAEPREVMHFALLFGYGAGCINPYMAFDTIDRLVEEKEISADKERAHYNYVKSVEKGILKILSKMGISRLQSYRGAQIFEALGLCDDLIERYFPGTVSRIGGAGLKEIAKETLIRHEKAFSEKNIDEMLDVGGVYQWRKGGETHLWNPDTIFALQQAARNNDPQKYKEFSALINNQSGYNATLRSLLRFKKTSPISPDEVEPASEIVKRFVTGAMSFGSISKETHETIAIAMNHLGGKSNTGEGGEDPIRFKPLPNGDSVRSAIKQVASGRFGVTNNYLTNADEIQIKMAQGAKPGEGGQLPGHKVNEIIARIRYSTPGITLISPPPHHDIYSIEDLAQLIFDLKNVNPSARISVKLVSEIGVGTVAAGVAKGHADMILISGGDGGTGASPFSSIKHAGLPWELGLSEAHQTLVLNGLRSRVRLQTDGQIRTGRDVVIAAILGAEEFGFSTAVLVVLGCVLLRHCHLNNCSLGIATQDEICRKRFSGKPEFIQNYLFFVAEEIRQIMASLGIRKIDDLIGRTDLLETDGSMLDWKNRNLDFSKILYRPENTEKSAVRRTVKQDHGIKNVLDVQLIETLKDNIANKQSVRVELPIKNVNRATGAMLSGRISALYGEDGLPDDTVTIKFTGTAGQSFGAFLAKGVTFELEGEANDYVGKGLSGGKIAIYPDKKTEYDPQKNIIIGNTTFYGATSGEAYIRGSAGERFCIRNSGVYAVVEGVGDHGCEYMTGGRVLILGTIGRNFAAGMSGGIAYVYGVNGDFKTLCNTELVSLEKCTFTDESILHYLLQNHYKNTRSQVAKKILDDFENETSRIVKVIPVEYKKVLAAIEPKKAKADEPFDF
ncbi:MAG: glutamate synthase large subunit [Candidatus Margulisiibacteriota bacterium]